MRMDKRKVTIHVGGKAYTLMSTDTDEYMQRMEALADRTLREISAATHQSVQASAILAVISLADEVIKSQDENSRLRRELYSTQEALAEANRQQAVLLETKK